MAFPRPSALQDQNCKTKYVILCSEFLDNHDLKGASRYQSTEIVAVSFAWVEQPFQRCKQSLIVDGGLGRREAYLVTARYSGYFYSRFEVRAINS